MPTVCLTRTAVDEAKVGHLTHVLCSDAEGRLARYRAGLTLSKFYSVNNNWFDEPEQSRGGTIWLEPPVDRARALCEAVIGTI